MSVSFIFNLKKISTILTFIIILFSFIIGYLPISHSLLSNLEKNAVNKNSGFQVYINENFESFEGNENKLISLLDGVIVLGGGFEGDISKHWNEASLKNWAERLTKSVEMFHKNNELNILFSSFSGSVNPKGWPDYRVAELFYKNMNVPPEKIFYEKKSKNTYENILYSKEIIHDNKSWGLITSAYHMKRVKAIIKKLKLKNTIYLIPVDFQTGKEVGLLYFNFSKGAYYWQVFLHEWIGLISYSFLERA